MDAGLVLITNEMMRDAKKPMAGGYTDWIIDIASNSFDASSDRQQAAEIARPAIAHVQSSQQP
jgi:hypothetical protein